MFVYNLHNDISEITWIYNMSQSSLWQVNQMKVHVHVHVQCTPCDGVSIVLMQTYNTESHRVSFTRVIFGNLVLRD